jgi:hypothetical protein
VAEREADTEHAKDAMRRQSWAEAYEELRALDPSALAAEDLEALADAAWWLSKAEESISVRQRAYAGYAAGGEDPRAALVAARLCIESALRGDVSVAGGWLARAKRHLADSPERPEHSFLSLVESNVDGDHIAEHIASRARGMPVEGAIPVETASGMSLR